MRYPPRERTSRYTRFVADSSRQRGESQPDIFIGQLPVLLPSAYIAHAVDAALGQYTVAKLQRLKGKHATTALVWLSAGYDAASVIRRIRGRILFDITGFYVLSAAPTGPVEHRDARLPGGPLTAEPAAAGRGAGSESGTAAAAAPAAASVDRPTFRGTMEQLLRDEHRRQLYKQCSAPRRVIHTPLPT